MLFDSTHGAMVRHLDLFSGIGGFALAAQWAWGEQHEVVSFCDIEPFAQRVLNKNFPGVPVSKNIFDLKGDSFGTVDIVTGGFPCQPFSQAGKRKGTDDNRYLWPEMLRVISEAQPTWVIGENVGGIATIDRGLVFERVCAEMENLGYEVQPLCIPACAVNAPHRRDRWWFVAHSHRRADGHTEVNTTEGRFAAFDGVEGCVASDAPDTAGNGRYNVRITEHGYVQERYVPTNIKQNGQDFWGSVELINTTSPQNFGDTESTGRESGEHGQGQIEHGRADQWSRHWLEVASAFCRVDDGLPGRVDRHRADRLKGLGNAIVPQVAYQIMMGIKHTGL